MENVRNVAINLFLQVMESMPFVNVGYGLLLHTVVVSKAIHFVVSWYDEVFVDQEIQPYRSDVIYLRTVQIEERAVEVDEEAYNGDILVNFFITVEICKVREENVEVEVHVCSIRNN